MKTILEYANSMKHTSYRVQLSNVTDKEGLPITVSIYVDNENVKEFEKYLNDEEGNAFIHAEGGNVEY